MTLELGWTQAQDRIYLDNTRVTLWRVDDSVEAGEVNESSFGPDLDDQTTLEAFYRFQLTPQIAITPSVEYIDSPALNPEENDLWLVGLRARLAL